MCSSCPWSEGFHPTDYCPSAIAVDMLNHFLNAFSLISKKPLRHIFYFEGIWNILISKEILPLPGGVVCALPHSLSLSLSLFPPHTVKISPAILTLLRPHQSTPIGMWQLLRATFVLRASSSRLYCFLTGLQQSEQHDIGSYLLLLNM